MLKQFQTALVTGASHGIGPIIARALARAWSLAFLGKKERAEVERELAKQPNDGRGFNVNCARISGIGQRMSATAVGASGGVWTAAGV